VSYIIIGCYPKLFVKMDRKMVVCVTGAAGKIAYSLYNTLCTSEVLGIDVDIELRLIEIQ
jgi:hypothetical protein